MYEQSLDLNAFQTFLNQHQSDPTFYDNFFNLATSTDAWKANNRLPGLPTPPSTPGNSDCRFGLFLDASPQGLQDASAFDSEMRLSQVRYTDAPRLTPYQNDEFPDCILSPISSPQEGSFPFIQYPDEQFTRLYHNNHPSKVHSVFHGRRISENEALPNENLFHTFGTYNKNSYSSCRTLCHETDTRCIHYPYNQQLQSQPMNNDCLGLNFIKSGMLNDTYYGEPEGFECQPCAAVYSENNSSNQENFETLLPNSSVIYNKNEINKNFHRRSQTQYYRQLAYEKIRTHQQKLNSSGSAENEPELSRATHNVLERQRRNELKLRFNILRDKIPDLALNDKAPKIQILKRGQELLKDLKAQEQKLIADHELEKQRQIILLNRIKYLQSGLTESSF